MLSQELCRLLDEIPETIEADITRLIKQCEDYEPSGNGAEIPAMPEWEKDEAEKFGKNPDLIDRLQADFQALRGSWPRRRTGCSAIWP